jgi:hypothetical protein
MHPTIRVHALADETPNDHRVDQPLAHELRTPEVTGNLISQPRPAYHRTDDGCPAGLPQNRRELGEIYALRIGVRADGASERMSVPPALGSTGDSCRAPASFRP